MSTPSPSGTPRPSQVTFAGWLTIGASLVAVVMAFAKVSQLGSADTQEAISRFLADEPGRSLGMSLADVQHLLRVTSTAAAVGAAATGVLGWFVLQRSRGSRIALSVIAVPLLIDGLFSAGFATAIVAASATMLWLQPARGWFARPGVDGSTPGGAPVTHPEPTPLAAPVEPVASYPPPTGSAYPAAAAYYGAPVRADARPMALTWACMLTWLFSAAVAGLLAVTAVVVAAAPDKLLAQAREQNPDLVSQGVSDTFIQTVVYVVAGVLILWSVAAAIVAVLAFRRVRWAMVVLLVSACLAGGLCLLLAIGSLVTVVVLLPCAVSVTLMLRPEVRQWYANPR